MDIFQDYSIVLMAGMLAGTASGMIGTGSSIILLPILVYVFGPKEAVPIMAVAAVIGNLSRIVAWWAEVDWRVVGAYSSTAALTASMGARTLWSMPANTIDIMLGIFFISMVPLRHYLQRHEWRLSLWQMPLAGALIGFVTGLVLSTGPLSVPAFSAYGLVKGAFLGTEAASSLIVYFSKVLTFTALGALTIGLALKGCIVGGSIAIGTFLAKSFVTRMPAAIFQRVLDGLLLLSGLSLLISALLENTR